jgi:hypothetical protein
MTPLQILALVVLAVGLILEFGASFLLLTGVRVEITDKVFGAGIALAVAGVIASLITGAFAVA